MGGPIEVSLKCLNCCMKCSQMVIHYQLVTVRRRRYYVWWVWSTRKYMHVQMILYCIEKSLKTLTKCPRCKVSRFKVKDDDIDEDNMKKGHQQKSYGIPRFKRLFANVHDAKDLILACKWKKEWWIVTTCSWFTLMEENWYSLSIVWEWSKKFEAWSCNWWHESLR